MTETVPAVTVTRSPLASSSLSVAATASPSRWTVADPPLSDTYAITDDVAVSTIGFHPDVGVAAGGAVVSLVVVAGISMGGACTTTGRWPQPAPNIVTSANGRTNNRAERVIWVIS